MDEHFWHEKWASKNIAFHAASPNSLLVEYFNHLRLASGTRVFVPLCGKTLDIAWLLQQGCRVVGAELSAIAVDELFSELDLTPQCSEIGELTHYHAENLDIFVGNIFELNSHTLGPVDAIYDRAALVALPEDLRASYAGLLPAITKSPPQLLITYEYAQGDMAGPPFSISDDELLQHYAGAHQLQLLSSKPVAGGLKGQCPAQEKVWLLKPKP